MKLAEAEFEAEFEVVFEAVEEVSHVEDWFSKVGSESGIEYKDAPMFIITDLCKS